MNPVQNLKEKLAFFAPSKEEFLLTMLFMLFLPFPSYFIAGWGLVPPLYTAVVILAFIIPRVSGLGLFLLVLYVLAMPLLIYFISVTFNRQIRDKKWIYLMGAALVVLGCLLPIYFIIDTMGGKTAYNAIRLYGELLF